MVSINYDKEVMEIKKEINEINCFNFLYGSILKKGMVLFYHYNELDFINYQSKLNLIKEFYNNLDLIFKDFKIADMGFNPNVFYYSDIYKIQISEENYIKLEKYLLNRKLENKLPIKNTKTKGKKI